VALPSGFIFLASKMPPPRKIVYSFVVYRAKATKFGKRRTIPVNFVRIEQEIRPLGEIILVKFQIFKVFRAVNPHSGADQGEIWQGRRSVVQRVFPVGRKPKNRP